MALANPSDQPTEAHPPADTEGPSTDQARRFGKARVARSTELLEDYAELISDLLAEGGEARPVDIARRLGVSAHVTVVKAVARLKREGLATARPYRAKNFGASS